MFDISCDLSREKIYDMICYVKFHVIGGSLVSRI